jgi:hypothetical protein
MKYIDEYDFPGRLKMLHTFGEIALSGTAHGTWNPDTGK